MANVVTVEILKSIGAKEIGPPKTFGKKYQSLTPMTWFIRPIARGSRGCIAGSGKTASM